MIRRSKTLVSLFAILVAPWPAVMAQNIGIGSEIAEARLDIHGDIIIRSADIVLENGAHTAVDVNSNPYSNFRLSGPTAPFTLQGITYASDGKLVTFFNRAGHTMTIVHESAAAEPSERILTGSGLNLEIPANASVNLQYDGGAQRWVVRSHSAPIAGGGGGNNFWLSNGGTGIYSTNAGNVGIGTQFAGYKLHVAGTGYFAGTSSTSYGPGEQGGFYFAGGGLAVSTPNLENFGAGIEANYLSLDGNRLQSFVRRLDDGSVNDYAQGLSLNPLGGNVGIGTNFTPGFAKLEIRIADNERGWAVGTPHYNMHTFLGGLGRSANSEGCYLGTSGVVTGGHPVPLHFFTNAQWAQMTLLPNGNVGIGTTNPTYRLSVNGNIRAKEVVIESIWADYVFEPDYALPTIESMQKFIAANRHLPGIPSAAVIGSQGLSVGSVQAKMMEKIEELSLYIIQLNERLRLLENKPTRQ